jgi:cytochrome P450
MNRIAFETPPRLRPPAPVPRDAPLGVFALLRALRDNPLEAWSRIYFEEPVVSARILGTQIAAVNDPGAIRRVLLENSGNYRKDALQRRMLAAVLDGGLLTAESEQWRVQRRTLAPLFAARTVRGFAQAMRDAADVLIAQWKRARGPVDVAHDVTGLTLDVLERTIFSDGLGTDRCEVRRAMRLYFDDLGRIDPLDLIGVPNFVPRVGRLKLRPIIRYFDSLVDAIIAARRRRLAGQASELPNDILGHLLQAQDPETGRGLSEAEVRANIITFIAAGHETTANAITWSLFLLSQSPEWMERVAEEAEREIDGALEGLADRLIQTRAVVEEAIRLYPPLVAISRAAKGPDELAGERIRRGALVVIAPYVLHRHSLWWEHPDCFDPRRFLPGRRDGIDRYAYLPFGVGPRSCIGASFALQEAVIVVASVVGEFNLRLQEGHRVWPVHRVTLRPQHGLPMLIEPRRAIS